MAVDSARKLFAGPCDFVWGATASANLPPADTPEIAFAGRSNVGKSSLINALTGRNGLARVSQTPGATRQINFFSLGGRLTLVDLPGYGYAKVSKAEAATWQDMVFAYLAGRPTLKQVALLIDARRGVGSADRAVMELLDRAAVSYGLVLTKMDELKPAAMAAALAAAGAQARTHTAALEAIAATSVRTGEGIAQLRARLAGLIHEE